MFSFFLRFAMSIKDGLRGTENDIGLGSVWGSLGCVSEEVTCCPDEFHTHCTMHTTICEGSGRGREWCCLILVLARISCILCSVA